MKGFLGSVVQSHIFPLRCLSNFGNFFLAGRLSFFDPSPTLRHELMGE